MNRTCVPTLVRAAHAGGFVRGSDSFREKLCYSNEVLQQKSILDWIHPADRHVFAQRLEDRSGHLRARHQTAQGSWVMLEWQVRSESGLPMVFGTVCSTPPSESPDTPQQTNQVPETIRDLLTAMMLITEEEQPGLKSSVLLLDESGLYVEIGVGPSLPAEYNAAIEGIRIGPMVGACGTAAYWNRPVIVEDIESDVLWKDLRDNAAVAGVRSCWSHPITSMSGKVLGATALYSPTPRTPSQAELERLERSARLFGLTIERWRAEEALHVSETRRRERDLMLKEQLHQSGKMEALGILAGGLAHDFNNVLGAVLGNAELAMEAIPEGSETHEMLNDIVTSSNRAVVLCSQMLTYAGRGIISPQRFDCNALIRNVSTLLPVTLPKKALLDYQLDSEALFVEADRGQFRQMIMNLITNAAESLEGGAGTITVQTDLCAVSAEGLATLQSSMPHAHRKNLRIRISDTGCGMSDEVKSRIFDPFFTTKFTGRGLGLAATQGIVSRHGGTIDVKSTLGKGTTFTVLLPCAGRPVEHQRPMGASVREHHARVLVVDDELALRRALSRTLKRAGFEVLQAVSGRDAIEIFRDEGSTIDCVLLDLSMPGLDGEQTFQELKRLRPDVRAVLNSGCSVQDMMSRFKNVGFSGMLQKPSSRDVLVEMLYNITGCSAGAESVGTPPHGHSQAMAGGAEWHMTAQA